MGYQTALEAAGAKVIEFHQFGSYQGTWLAILDTYEIVTGSYGSCSHCDAFESEFGYSDNPTIEDGKFFDKYYEEITEAEYNEQMSEYNDRLRKFGESYLKDTMTFKFAIDLYKRKTEEDYAWDDDVEMYNWLVNKASEFRVVKIDSILDSDK